MAYAGDTKNFIAMLLGKVYSMREHTHFEFHPISQLKATYTDMFTKVRYSIDAPDRGQCYAVVIMPGCSERFVMTNEKLWSIIRLTATQFGYKATAVFFQDEQNHQEARDALAKVYPNCPVIQFLYVHRNKGADETDSDYACLEKEERPELAEREEVLAEKEEVLTEREVMMEAAELTRDAAELAQGGECDDEAEDDNIAYYNAGKFARKRSQGKAHKKRARRGVTSVVPSEEVTSAPVPASASAPTPTPTPAPTSAPAPAPTPDRWSGPQSREPTASPTSPSSSDSSSDEDFATGLDRLTAQMRYQRQIRELYGKPDEETRPRVTAQSHLERYAAWLGVTPELLRSPVPTPARSTPTPESSVTTPAPRGVRLLPPSDAYAGENTELGARLAQHLVRADQWDIMVKPGASQGGWKAPSRAVDPAVALRAYATAATAPADTTPTPTPAALSDRRRGRAAKTDAAKKDATTRGKKKTSARLRAAISVREPSRRHHKRGKRTFGDGSTPTH